MPLPAFGRAKRVTGLLGDAVKARLRGDDSGRGSTRPYPCSSGATSEHEAADLSGFVRGFFFPDVDDGSGGDHGSDEEGGRPGSDEDEGSAGQSDGEAGRHQSLYCVPATGMIRDLVNPRAEDRFRRDLQADAAAAAERFAGLRPNQQAFRRAVMGSLRGTGYNAGICASRWERDGGGLVAGAFEYVDVMVQSPSPTTTASTQQRYIVDVDFAGEFEIARPTAEYGRMAAELPTVYVGRPEELRRLLRVLAEAARRSLRSRGMHVPPWRRSRYVQAKWLGPHRRTVLDLPSPSPPSPPPAAAPSPPPSLAPGRGDVKCRFVGFDAAAAAAASVIPPAARTR